MPNCRGSKERTTVFDHAIDGGSKGIMMNYYGRAQDDFVHGYRPLSGFEERDARPERYRTRPGIHRADSQTPPPEDRAEPDGPRWPSGFDRRRRAFSRVFRHDLGGSLGGWHP